MLSPSPFQTVRTLAYAVAASLLLLGVTACGGGGGDGTPPPAVPAQTLVSGSVQAPNGQVVFHQPGIGDFFEALFVSSAYASLSGLSPVPDGTAVQLGRMSSAGTFTVLASTTVSGGRYSFNLTSLGLTFASDLVVGVINGPVQMRAFVTWETADLNPVSESTVQVVLDHLATAGTSLGNFTPQELRDLAGAIDALTASNQSAAGADINTTISSIKTAVTNEPGIATFLLSAGGPGQTNEGTGDIGNFVPLAQSSTWSFQGADTTTGQAPISYSNTATITGTKLVGGVETTVLSQTNPLNEGTPEESYYTKDSRGLTFHGNNDPTDVVTPQLVPHVTLRFPFWTGSTFEEINKKGLNFGQDLDGDGANEKADLFSIVTVKGFEDVTTPARTFSNCAKVETRATVTVIASRNGATVTVETTQTMWFAPGIGPVKSVLQVLDQTLTEELTEFRNRRVINLTTNDLIYDSGSQKIYASIPGSPGNIRTIDPTTGSIGSPIPVGIDPVKLARSDNGQFLYVGLAGENSVQRIDLSTQTVNLTFSLGSDLNFGPRFAKDIEVLPANPGAVAVSMKYATSSAGVAIFDNGVQRPTSVPHFLGSGVTVSVIEFSASASRLYGYNNENTEWGFRRMAVDQSGVSVTDVTQNLITLFNVDILFHNGLIYTTSGKVIDPENLIEVGTFPGISLNMPVRPDSTVGKVFFLEYFGGLGIKIHTYDINTRQLLKTVEIAGVGEDFGTPTNLIRWGSKGLAFRTTGGQVFLIESTQLIP